MNNQAPSFWRANRVPLILLAVCMAAAAVVFQFLPEAIPMQWDAAGQVSRYGSRWEIFLVAALPAIIYWAIRAKYGRR